jgi:hypothetical protein
MKLNRRAFLASTGGLLAQGVVASRLSALGMASAADQTATGDTFRLRIEPCTIEIGHGVSVKKTIAYNGLVPAPCYV